MTNRRMPPRGATMAPEPSAWLRRLEWPLAATLFTIAAVFGWYRVNEAKESEREMSRRLSSAERELAEARSNLEHCTAWMDSRWMAAQQEPPSPAQPVAPPSSADSPAPAVDSAEPEPTAPSPDAGIARATHRDLIKLRFMQRRQRWLEARGEALAASETGGQSEGGPGAVSGPHSGRDE